MDYHIWKIELDKTKIGEEQTIQLPADSTLLSVGEQDGNIVLWFQFPSENRGTNEPHRFLIAFTGGPTKFPKTSATIFKGTVQLGPFVNHVFSLI